MPLRHQEPPAEVHEAVEKRLGALAYHGGFHTPRLRHAKPDSLFTAMPHRTAVLTSRQIAGGNTWAQHIDFKGWRFLVLLDDEIVASVDTLDESGAHRFGHINEGPLVAGTTDAIGWAEEQAAVRTGSFEPILVLIHEFSVSLLLLRHHDGGGDDHVIAIPPLFAGLRDRELLQPGHIVDALRPIIARRGDPTAPGRRDC